MKKQEKVKKSSEPRFVVVFVSPDGEHFHRSAIFDRYTLDATYTGAPLMENAAECLAQDAVERIKGETPSGTAVVLEFLSFGAIPENMTKTEVDKLHPLVSQECGPVPSNNDEVVGVYVSSAKSNWRYMLSVIYLSNEATPYDARMCASITNTDIGDVLDDQKVENKGVVIAAAELRALPLELDEQQRPVHPSDMQLNYLE